MVRKKGFRQRPIDHLINRWYYTISGYPNLLLVSHPRPYPAWQDQHLIALFEIPDSCIVYDVLPAAPTEWHEVRLLQCTIKPVKELPDGPAIPLFEAVNQKIVEMLLTPAFVTRVTQGPVAWPREDELVWVSEESRE